MQSINFARGLPKDTSRLSPQLMGWIVLGVFSTLFLLSVFVAVNQVKTHRELKQVQSRLNETEASYKTLAASHPLLVSELPMEERLQRLKEKVHAEQSKLDTLEHLIVRQGFSMFMRGLANVTPKTMWLRQIQIYHNRNNLLIKGYSTDPDALSTFMGQLQRGFPFNRLVFNLFYIQTLTHRAYVKFSIATKDLGLKETSDKAKPAGNANQTPKENDE